MSAELQPERVPARRLAPLAVALAIIGVLGVMIAKPWEGAAPSPRPTSAALGPSAAPQPSGLPSETEIPSASQSPLPVAIQLPPPDFGPVGAAGPYSLTLVSDMAMARCGYERARRGPRHLASMEVQPPVVEVDNPRSDVRDVRSLGWRFELQMNRQQSVFDRAWQTVARSRLQLAAAVSGRPANFTPLTIRYDASGDEDTAVFRALVIVEWYTRNVELAGRAELFASRYLEANDEFDGQWPAYCSGVRTTAS